MSKRHRFAPQSATCVECRRPAHYVCAECFCNLCDDCVDQSPEGFQHDDAGACDERRRLKEEIGILEPRESR